MRVEQFPFCWWAARVSLKNARKPWSIVAEHCIRLLSNDFRSIFFSLGFFLFQTLRSISTRLHPSHLHRRSFCSILISFFPSEIPFFFHSLRFLVFRSNNKFKWVEALCALCVSTYRPAGGVLCSFFRYLCVRKSCCFGDKNDVIKSIMGCFMWFER